jgi:hypothetical protein
LTFASSSFSVRQTLVLERVAGSLARKEIQSLAATKSAITLRLASLRAMVALTPPMRSTQASASR